MSLRINHNITALDGHRNMVNNDAMVSRSIQRLSSGLRINRAADDAAGLVISEQMRAQIGGLNQAIANSEQAVTMVQTAEGALDEVNSLLSKGRSLAVHAANSGVNDTNQLIADQSELDNIVDSVNRISANTQFGTKKILDGSLSNATTNSASVASVSLGGDYTKLLTSNTAVRGYHTLQITQGATQATDVMSLAATDVFTAGTLAAAAGGNLVKKSFTLSVNGALLNVASGTTKNQFVQQLNAIGAKVGFTAATTGAGSSGNVKLTAKDFGRSFTFNVQFVSGASGASALAQTTVAGVDAKATLYLYTGGNGIGGTATSGSAAGAQITFTATGAATNPGGIGLTMTSSGGSTIVLSTNVSSGASKGFVYGAIDGTHSGAVFQVGANVNQTATVQLQSTNASQLGVGGSGSFSSLAQVKGSSLISGQANEVLKVIDKAIDDITNLRGNLGSFQANTLETGLNSLRVTQENLTSAESTIRDVDFAEESSNFTRNNILVQSSTAMLAQANQLPQQVLKLLA